MRDVTPRYTSNWCTSTRRMRLSEEWWRETLEPYAGDHEEGLVEDGDILSEWYMPLMSVWVCGVTCVYVCGCVR